MWLAGAVADWSGFALQAVALSMGLAVFLVVGDPADGKDFASTRAWVVVAAVLGPAIALCTIAAMRTLNTARAVLLALATALLYSVTAVLTKSAVTELGEGIVPFLTSWEPYVGIAAGAVALLLNLSAFQAGELQASLPMLTAAEPIVGSVLGFLMLDELLTASGTLEWTAVAVAAVVIVGAVVALSMSAARHETQPTSP